MILRKPIHARLFNYPPSQLRWAWPDLNRRPSLCESDVITARPQALSAPNCIVSYYLIAASSIRSMTLWNSVSTPHPRCIILLEKRFLLRSRLFCVTGAESHQYFSFSNRSCQLSILVYDAQHGYTVFLEEFDHV